MRTALAAVAAATVLTVGYASPVGAQDYSWFVDRCRDDQTSSLALGDLDGDGQLDLVVGNGRHSAEPNLLYIAGSPVDLLHEARPLGNAGTYAVRLGDLDADGNLDLVVLNDFGYRHRAYINDGRGNLALGDTFGREDPSRDGVLADIDGDGDTDVLVANRGAPNRAYLNDGEGRFDESRDIDTGENASIAVAVADVDGDGDPDVAVANREGQPNAIYLNDGRGRFPERRDLGRGGDESVAVAFADWDGDGDADAAVGNLGGANAVYFNDGAGGFATSAQFGTGTDHTRAVLPNDVDGDGDLDLVVGNAARDIRIRGSLASRDLVILNRSRDEPNRVYFNDGTGEFRPGPTFGQPGSRTRAVATGDMDGDGRADLVVGNNCGGNAIYLNGPSGDG